MTKKTRTILFLFLAILFFLVAPLIVLYSLGYRFDWETKKITQPGIFYFKVNPKNTQVYLNGKFKKKTDFFFGSALVENLPPEKYAVEIKKEGFHSWEKTLEIKKRTATEAKNIILIPKNPSFAILFKGVEKLFFSPDEKKIILKELETAPPEETVPTNKLNESESSKPNESWSLKLFELDKNIKSHLIESDRLAPETETKKERKTQLLDLIFSPDSQRVLLKIKTEEKSSEEQISGKINYYILKIDETPPALTSLDFLNSEVEKIDFNPKDSQKLFALVISTDESAEKTQDNEKQNENDKKLTLNEIDLVNEKISQPILEDIIAYSITDNDIYYLDASGFLYKADFSLSQKNKLNINPFPLKKEFDYQITAFPSGVILKEKEILYIFDKERKSFDKISESVKNFKFSPYFEKLAYFNDYEIWVLFLEEKNDQPQKEAGDKSFLTRFSEKIDKVFWYTSHYLIFNVKDKIKIIEIDDRDRINIVDFAEFKEPEIFWNQVYKKLYILTNENLYVSEKLVP